MRSWQLSNFFRRYCQWGHKENCHGCYGHRSALLYKNETLKEVANYRKIVLVNMAAKRMVSSFCAWLKPMLQYLMPPSQTSRIAGRKITKKQIIAQKITHWAKSSWKGAILICVDFAKAYETVQWSCLKEVLQEHGCATGWMNLSKAFYSGRETVLTINGNIRKNCAVRRGVFGGGPISLFLSIF